MPNRVIYMEWSVLLILTVYFSTTGGGLAENNLLFPRNGPDKKNHQKHSPMTINKVSLTQKGYIQFLRYITDAPPIDDFTFCIWLRSSNLTFSHPILSYSKHEEDRYIRAWISPHGKEINLAILENEIFKIPIKIRENVWYHICQSWSSRHATWNFFLNGKIKASGYEPKLNGLTIPKGGDLVVGQEYTDFDKGLEDGIEGDIFGFNMILASTATALDLTSNFIAPLEYTQRRNLNVPGLNYHPKHNAPTFINTLKPRNIPGSFRNHGNYYNPENYNYANNAYSVLPEEEVPSVLSYFTTGANRAPKGFVEFGNNIYRNVMNMFQPEVRNIRVKSIDEFNAHQRSKYIQMQQMLAPPRIVIPPGREGALNNGRSRILTDVNGIIQKPLGLQLVELSYNCALGKGSPINHDRVLVSWTKTPVRVFGGAILKTVSPFCMKA